MEQTVSIRKAETGDIRQIKKILFNALKEYEIAVPDNYSVSDIESIDRKDTGERVFILQKDGRVIGFVGLRGIDRDCVELKRLYLASSERGKKLGAYLLKYAIDFASRNNYQSIRLETTSRFKAAVSLYKKFGFKVVKQAEKSPGHDLAFEKKLVQPPPSGGNLPGRTKY